ncbi:uncharacterized protein LOC115316188 [Ixodes scapularis]|uniref:uncharacterized protein LOC115316188 n=1 Tax=Ixodes scapularis TaxID=6945 RepID=UPI001A9F6112|nr:uncharacterized protein LOC115316188 [Ixodes scapularis]
MMTSCMISEVVSMNMDIGHWTQRERRLLFTLIFMSVFAFCLFVTATVLGERARERGYELEQERSKTLPTPVPNVTIPTTVSSSEIPNSTASSEATSSSSGSSGVTKATTESMSTATQPSSIVQQSSPRTA